MGTSTVSGPFRSQNGFQELVNGVWTPVGSGGGGGSNNVTIIPWTPGLNFYTIPALEVGQTASFAWEFHPGYQGPTNYLEVTMAPIPGVDAVYFFAVVSDTFNNVSQNSGMNSVAVAGSDMASSLFTATFVNTIVYGGDTFAIIGINAANVLSGG